MKPSAEARAWDLSLTIREGRTREIRRLCDAVGLEVLRLVRTSFGPVKLGALAFHAAVLLLFAASVLKLSAQSFSPFLYFQF